MKTGNEKVNILSLLLCMKYPNKTYNSMCMSYKIFLRTVFTSFLQSTLLLLISYGTHIDVLYYIITEGLVIESLLVSKMKKSFVGRED